MKLHTGFREIHFPHEFEGFHQISEFDEIHLGVYGYIAKDCKIHVWFK